jgi:hypothetical protein
MLFLGEKRKRKLQYLQQLIKDGGPTDDQQPEVTEQQHCQRILTPEYYTPETIAKNMTIPPNDNYSALSSSSDGTIGSSIATTATTYQTQFQPTAPSYPPYDPTWNAPMYEIPAPINIWNVPTWIPNIEFSPPMTTRSADDFDFTPPPHSHDDFHQLPTPPRQMHTPEPDFFVMGSYAAQYRRQHEQSMGMSSMSLPSSPFCYPRYPGPS